ncbi:MAG TPA: diaminopropionate ammonia-lyase [Candidatus Aphodousia faecigallinarum]|uniref:Diaminopropionate ammonia-lyase n=1 Tax=Candidatus Aphodousia faecigallinarum TaxID=2840677 RepID=A0A9D1IIE9_9BURK|nr:diaminopropionate ammonia-lyase [Candidatus Aphodousia faecigallinarum]
MMSDDILVAHLSNQPCGTALMPLFNVEAAHNVRRYHETVAGYKPTPLKSLSLLAQHLGVKNIFVKDESYRFGLNAFKALGSSYCMASLLAERLELPLNELSFDAITTEKAKEALGQLTFVTATDGNHGRGVAWSAQTLGHKSIVLMPKGTAAERLENIKKLGSDASITELVYDDTVKLAAQKAKEIGGILVQDTAWDGYEDIPLRIMQGYLTLGLEMIDQLQGVRPTHVFLQAGVGSMAAAIAAFFANLYGDKRPIITIVEPHGANCLYKTALANDGAIHAYEGNLHSIMAGLCCGVPCTVAWDLLKECADYFVSMPDFVAADGMRILGAPLGNDPRVISGESGASTFGLVADCLRKPEYEHVKETLQLNDDSTVLCISTEGDTDQSNYRHVVWDGGFSSN